MAGWLWMASVKMINVFIQPYGERKLANFWFGQVWFPLLCLQNTHCCPLKVNLKSLCRQKLVSPKTFVLVSRHEFQLHPFEIELGWWAAWQGTWQVKSLALDAFKIRSNQLGVFWNDSTWLSLKGHSRLCSLVCVAWSKPINISLQPIFMIL